MMKTIFIQTIYKLIIYVAKHFILKLIRSYLGKLFTFLFNKYPFLYNVVGYFFNILAVFNIYLYSTVFRLHNKFKDNFPILYSITVYIYIEYLAIIHGNLSRNMGVIIGLYVLFSHSYLNIILYSLLWLNTFFKEYLIKKVWIRTNYPTLHQRLLDISSLVNSVLILYFLELIWLEIVVPFGLKSWNGLLNMYDPVRDRTPNEDSGSEKPPGKSPKEPKDPSDSEYYINKHGKKVKRRYKKRTEEENKRASRLAKERYRKKVEAEGRKLGQHESLVGLTDKEKYEYKYEQKRNYEIRKREEEKKRNPLLKDIRRKNRKMSKQEIEEFDRISVENRKKSMAEYRDAKKGIYRDVHNLYEDPDYVKPLEGEKNIRFVEYNLTGKNKEIFNEETLPEESLDKGKGKAKVDELIISSGSENSVEYSEDSAFEEDTNEAIRQSRNHYNKKGESSKKGGESSKKGGSK